MKVSRREFLAAVPAVGLAAEGQGLETRLWFSKPAAQWTEALPVGNGRLGAMVFGGVGSERLQLNHDTLWTGRPKDWNNPEAKTHLAEVRRLVLDDENYAAADALCRKMQGPYNEAFQPMGNLHIAFDNAGDASGYSRELDLDSAIAKVLHTHHCAVSPRRRCRHKRSRRIQFCSPILWQTHSRLFR